MTVSLDCETTGVDFWHGARPFFVTSCDGEGQVSYWRFGVDPETREVRPPGEDLDEIRRLVGDADRIVGQNLKFDVHALGSIMGFTPEEFPWGRIEDTLVAGHVLASNRPHNLTDMAIQYLGVDIEPRELALKDACDEARRWCRSHEPDFAIAKAGRPDMPSAKEKCWKYDTWLPRTLVQRWWEGSIAGAYWENSKGSLDPRGDHLDEEGEVLSGRRLRAYLDRLRANLVEEVSGLDGWQYRPPEVEGGDHSWWTVLEDYANADSEVTLALWRVMERELNRRNLWRIYRERMKVVPIAARMEAAGVTLSGSRLTGLVERYRRESEEAAGLCVNLAADAGFDLVVPKGGNNGSLRAFLFDVLKLPAVKTSEKTGDPSLDKAVMDEYEHVLPPRSTAGTFVRTLKGKKKRDTSVSYLEGYRRFWRPLGDAPRRPVTTRVRNYESDDYSLSTSYEQEWHLLHPNLNVTGTDTLRMSSGNPNAQNIAKQDVACGSCRGEGCRRCDGSGKDLWSLRYCFGPTPGREWWSLDAKNIELRLPAYLSGEEELVALFERPDDPPYYGSVHLLNFHTVYPDIWERELREVGFEKVGPHCKKKYASTWYQWDKNGGFSKQYGGGRAKVDATFHRAGAFDLIDSRLSKLAKLNAATIAYAERQGYVETIPDRTVDPDRGYPLLCTRTEYGKVLSTVPLNYKIQGSAMWWTAKAMVKCQAQLDEWREDDGFDGRIALQVHDELVFDFPRVGDPVAEDERVKTAKGKPVFRSSNLWRIRAIQRLMESCGQDFVPSIPTPVGVEYHADNWSEGVTL